MYEQEENLEQAIVYYEKAADLFQSEEVSTSANQCRQKIAQFAAQLEQLSLLASLYGLMLLEWELFHTYILEPLAAILLFFSYLGFIKIHYFGSLIILYIFLFDLI